MQTVAGLSALTRFHMWSHGPHDGLMTPRGEELACLRSASIQEVAFEVREIARAVLDG